MDNLFDIFVNILQNDKDNFEGTDISSISLDTPLKNITDSMGILIILLSFEQLGFKTKYIDVSSLVLVKDLLDKVSKCEKV